MLQVLLICAALFVYYRLQRPQKCFPVLVSDPGDAKAVSHVPWQALASRNRVTPHQLEETLDQLNSTIDQLVSLRSFSVPECSDTLPFVFRNRAKFVIPISPDIPGTPGTHGTPGTPKTPLSPILDRTEQIATAAFQINIYCFQLQVMAYTHAPLLANKLSSEYMSILQGIPETARCVAEMLGVVEKCVYEVY